MSVARLSLDAIRNKQEEQNEDDEKHNGPLRVMTKHVHSDNLLQDGMGAATCGYSPVDAGGCCPVMDIRTAEAMRGL